MNSRYSVNVDRRRSSGMTCESAIRMRMSSGTIKRVVGDGSCKQDALVRTELLDHSECEGPGVFEHLLCSPTKGTHAQTPNALGLGKRSASLVPEARGRLNGRILTGSIIGAGTGVGLMLCRNSSASRPIRAPATPRCLCKPQRWPQQKRLKFKHLREPY